MLLLWMKYLYICLLDIYLNLLRFIFHAQKTRFFVTNCLSFFYCCCFCAQKVLWLVFVKAKKRTRILCNDTLPIKWLHVYVFVLFKNMFLCLCQCVWTYQNVKSSVKDKCPHIRISLFSYIPTLYYSS